MTDFSRCEDHASNWFPTAQVQMPHVGITPPDPRVGPGQVTPANTGDWGQDTYTCAAYAATAAGMGSAAGAAAAMRTFQCDALPHPVARLGCKIVSGSGGALVGGISGASGALGTGPCAGFHVHTPNCNHK